MSGFSPEWLALREPADHAARNADLAARVQAHFQSLDEVTVLDLGCGTGSNLRALAPGLPLRQTWRLVDWDRKLLDAARDALAAWARQEGGDAQEVDGELRLRHSRRDILVRFEQADLSSDPTSVLADADLVTATAFFDLVSTEWIARFCEGLAQRGLPLYAVLTYNGDETWEPPHAADAMVLAAFHAHQQGEKGFGPAAGPFAAAHLERVLESHGYRVACAKSPWRLGPDQAALVHELVAGSAVAVAETGLVPPEVLKSWRTERAANSTATIGHTDLFATRD